MGFWGFWGFCCFILYRFENRWVFAASYFVVLRVDGVFGVFAASYFIILRIGGVFGCCFFFCCFIVVILRGGGFICPCKVLISSAKNNIIVKQNTITNLQSPIQ